jgi:hypothetical protein
VHRMHNTTQHTLRKLYFCNLSFALSTTLGFPLAEEGALREISWSPTCAEKNFGLRAGFGRAQLWTHARFITGSPYWQTISPLRRPVELPECPQDARFAVHVYW